MPIFADGSERLLRLASFESAASLKCVTRRPEAVKEIVKGRKCSIHQELQSILRKPQYEHVAFVTAAADREKYQLNFDYPIVPIGSIA